MTKKTDCESWLTQNMEVENTQNSAMSPIFVLGKHQYVTGEIDIKDDLPHEPEAPVTYQPLKTVV